MNTSKNCDWCDSQFNKKNKTHRFCSRQCRRKWHKVENGETTLPHFITQKKSKATTRTFSGFERHKPLLQIASIKSPKIAALQTKINWLESQKIGNPPGMSKLLSSGGLFLASKMFTDNLILNIGAAALPFILSENNSQNAQLQNANVQMQIDELQIQINQEKEILRIENEAKESIISPVQVYQDYKIINAEKVGTLENEKYLLDGQWRYFLNYLPHSFNAIIHGLPKAGKTHLAIQFAQYLEKKFGNVLYISGEEGVEQPFNDKLEKYNSSFKVAYDVKGGFGIMKVVESVKPKFLFIDSLNRLGLNVNDIISFKENFPNTVFIYIVQSTKGGNFKGGQDIAHEVTSMIKVVEGIAHQKGRTVPEPTELKIFKQ